MNDEILSALIGLTGAVVGALLTIATTLGIFRKEKRWQTNEFTLRILEASYKELNEARSMHLKIAMEGVVGQEDNALYRTIDFPNLEMFVDFYLPSMRNAFERFQRVVVEYHKTHNKLLVAIKTTAQSDPVRRDLKIQLLNAFNSLDRDYLDLKKELGSIAAKVHGMNLSESATLEHRNHNSNKNA